MQCSLGALLFLTLLSSAATQDAQKLHEPQQPWQTPDTLQQQDESELMYQKVMLIRGNASSSPQDQRDALAILRGLAFQRLNGTPEQTSSPAADSRDTAVSYSTLAAMVAQAMGSADAMVGSMQAPASSKQPHPGALRELAKVFQEGQLVRQHMVLALLLFKRASELGDSEAQGEMGIRYALGLQDLSSWDEHGIVAFGQPDEAEAMLHYYYGALGGDAVSSMALGFRHLNGLGVPRNCWTAATYYSPVAEQVAGLATRPSSLPQLEKMRLHIAASSGSKGDLHREVVQYYQYSADRGNVDAQTAVGQVLNYGTHGVARDHAAALRYFQKAADAGDADAAAHLGHMYANGFGTPASAAQALKWFTVAARHNNANAQFGLGYLHLVGSGVPEDVDAAFKHFSQAAEQSHPDAHFFMGVMHLKGLGVRRKNVQRAFSHFTIAAQLGHILAMYNAGQMQLAGKGASRSCKPGVQLMKQMCERGPAVAVLQQGHEQYFKSQYHDALLSYLKAGEMGIELGQSNAAWMLDRGYVREAPSVRNAAVRLYKLSADAGNVNSLLMLGDAFFYGRGAPQDWVRASAIYYEAYAERSSEAMFNLGFMHEFGAGVPQDLSLARRFYHMAKHTHTDAALPVLLADAWLRLHEIWQWLRPHLPKQYEPLTSRIFTLQPPHTSLFGAVPRSLALLAPTQLLMHAEMLVLRYLDMGSFVRWAGGGEMKDVGETLTLVALLVVLYFVMKVRRRRAVGRQGFEGGVLGPDGLVVPGQAHGLHGLGLRELDQGAREQEQDGLPAGRQEQDG